jgi:glycosyltransferase involved in cell wall biosynthesis
MIVKKNEPIKILMFIGHYLPGFKSGGILRSVQNTIHNLADEFEFSIITRDCDLGENTTYSGIKSNQWQSIEGVKVFYLDHKRISLRQIYEVINNTDHEIIYLNSYFEVLSIMVLVSRKINKIEKSPIILAPRGEFSWASLKLKYPKKLIYMICSRLFHLYKDVIWHASTVIEQDQIAKEVRIGKNDIHIAKDLPMAIKKIPTCHKKLRNNSELRIVFISRISPEKNLDYALRVLTKININVIFDVYGSTENENYWNRCKTLINKLPENIKMSYRGELDPGNVVNTFSGYDVFLFPSGGENYGHVIAESLSAGTPVLVSNNTPWLGLEKKNLGWDFDLKKIDSFVDVINKLALTNKTERDEKRNYILDNIEGILFNKKDHEDNRQLYLRALARG